MAEKLIYDHRGDVVRTLYVADPTQDALDQDATWVIEQECDPVLEHVRFLRDAGAQRFGPGGHWRHVAEIPAVMAEPMMRDGSLNDSARLKRLLNSNEYRALRVYEGRL